MKLSFHFPTLILAAIALFIGLASTKATAQQTAAVTLKNGQVVEVVIVSLGGDHINWRYAAGGGTSKLPFTKIDGIAFPPTAEWAQAMADFEAKNYTAAVEKFKQISLTKGASTYYPAPGNFTNLAQRRLIDCYRRLRNPEEIDILRRRIEWDKIPSKEHKIGGVVACWAAAGGDDREAALKLIAEESKKLDWTDPLRGELAYVRALVHQKMKEEQLAVVAFGEAYGAYPGVDPSLSADAMEQAITILAQYPERNDEMNSVVRMYAGMYGDGKLWESAPADVAEVLETEMELVGASNPEQNKNKIKLVRGRFVRIEVVSSSLALAEVQLIASGENIAPQGTATQKSTQNKLAAKLAIDGNTDGASSTKSYSMTAAGDEGKKWWELDMGSSVVIDKIIVWNREAKQAAAKLEGFDIMVFNDDRTETIFEQRENKKVGRKVEFILNEAKLIADERAAAEKAAAELKENPDGKKPKEGEEPKEDE